MGLARQIKRLQKRREEAAAKKRRRKAFLEPLEPRLLLSADRSKRRPIPEAVPLGDVRCGASL